MTGAEPALIETASEFAAEVSDLLGTTVVDEPAIGAQVTDDRVVVAAFDDDGNTVDMPLTIQGVHRLDLRVSFRCTFDVTESFLAIEQSEFALIVPTVRHPVVRFDYDRARAWASAHVQLHAESSAVGFLRAHAGKTSETWRLHLPVGGRRFRPSLEDVIEFAIAEFNVDRKGGYAQRIEEGRERWRRLQAKAAIRDVIRDDPTMGPNELREAIELAVQSIGDSIAE